MKLITIGSQCFNLEAITHASYDENKVLDRLVNDDGTLQNPTEPGCTISFGTDDILCLYGDEALQAWIVLQFWVKRQQEESLEGECPMCGIKSEWEPYSTYDEGEFVESGAECPECNSQFPDLEEEE